MRKNTILDKILGFFGFGKVEEVAPPPPEPQKKPALTGLEKPKAYINREYTTEEIQRKAKIKELETRKLNFCFIPEKQNSINVRSMLEFIYRELPKKAPYGYKGKLRFYMWSKTRKILEKKHYKEVLLENLDGTPYLDENGRKQYADIYVCELCGESGKYHQGNGHHTECHEVWEFDDKYKTAVLKRLLVVCPKCHQVAHINMHKADESKFKELLARYCFINGLLLNGENGIEPDWEKAIADYEFADKERENRKEKIYSLDVTLWFKFFHKSIEDDGKLIYFDIKGGHYRFRTDNEEFIKFLESEFKGINTEV